MSVSEATVTAKPVEKPIADKAKVREASVKSEKRDAEIAKKEAASVTKEKPTNTSNPKAPSKPKVLKRPSIHFEEPVHEFGEITEGDIIKHKFTFKNTGNAELVIKSAKASCGCTDPSYPFLDIPPGETGYIGVTYNSVSKDGPQKPEVTIKTNVDDTSIVLYLSGVVLPKEEVEEKKEEEGNR